jgi:hypothetical protein
MAQAFHVNGPAYMYAAVGANNAWTALGYTEAGVDVEITNAWTPVMCDAAGVELPADLQRMGRSATITAPMVAYDQTTLDLIEKRGGMSSPAVGSEGTVGELQGTGGYSFGFGWKGPTDQDWRFTNCVLVNPHRARMGTKYTVDTLVVRAWVFVPATVTNAATVAALTLYDHTTIS